MDKNINLELWFSKKSYIKFTVIICQNPNLNNKIPFKAIKIFFVNDVVVILQSTKKKDINS